MTVRNIGKQKIKIGVRKLEQNTLLILYFIKLDIYGHTVSANIIKISIYREAIILKFSMKM